VEFQGFYQSLREGKIAKLYVFSGQEAFIKASALRDLRQKILPEGFEDMNEALLDNPSADALIAAAETLPMLGEKRLVVVRECALLTGGKARDEAAESERLLSYIQNLPETACIVFYCTANPDKRKKLTAALMKQACCVQFDPLDDVNLAKWMRGRLKTHGKTISPGNVQLLAFTSGRDLTQLCGELDKLVSYCGERTEITQEDIRRVATRTTECSIFELMDALVAGQRGKSLQLLTRLLEGGEQRIGILAMILRQYRQLLYLRMMSADNLPQSEQMKRLGVAPFVYKRLLAQGKAYSDEQLRQYVDLCVDTDYAIKSGRMREEAALDRVLLLLCAA
jgi:DNA polymerase-3 subunit delta